MASYLEEHMIPRLIGRNSFQAEDIWQDLYRGRVCDIKVKGRVSVFLRSYFLTYVVR